MVLKLSLAEEPDNKEDKKKKKIKNLDDRGTLTVIADKIKKTEDKVKFQISALLSSKRFLCFGSDAPYLMIERARQVDNLDFVRIWQSRTAHDDISPWWEPQELSMTEFCNNNKMLPLRLTVYNYRNNGTHESYGYVETSTRGIEMVGSEEPMIIRDKKGKKMGELFFNQFQMDMRPSLDYYTSNAVGQGWEMQISIAIDFTLSNLEITD